MTLTERLRAIYPGWTDEEIRLELAAVSGDHHDDEDDCAETITREHVTEGISFFRGLLWGVAASLLFWTALITVVAAFGWVIR